MGGDHLLAIDHGTQSVRALLFDPRGELVARHQVEIEPYESPHPGWAELDPEYRYAVVGHPSRDYLWILARTRTMDPADYETLLARIEAQAYDLERLNETPQPPAP